VSRLTRVRRREGARMQLVVAAAR